MGMDWNSGLTTVWFEKLQLFDKNGCRADVLKIGRWNTILFPASSPYCVKEPVN